MASQDDFTHAVADSEQTMAEYANENVSKPDKTQQIVVNWMINNPKAGFQEAKLPSKSKSPQFVSISNQDVKENPELQKISMAILSHSTIDRQGLINVDIGTGKKKVVVPFVNVQAQIGLKPNRHTYSHVNVVADKVIGVSMIRQALNESLKAHDSRWVVETAPGQYRIQADRPT
ncbi:hypothetical protein PENCOP_c006G00080 [Penicillium coprophilum]|uniref:Uncharacterized protein n=1 Tax=Penicillium coprophilum TaxID=36646 RepID=A0A1V6UN16_9EURO|nr:hypothetical protein PENCOP_c006G00080 [Penicillium coprophilum]